MARDKSECVMERTCWRGVVVEHPSAWEISMAAGPGEQGRLTFVDRRYTRLDLRWRPLTYVPNMPDMLERFRREVKQADDGTELLPLKGVPEPWKGFHRRGQQGSVIHATRFFKEQRLLMEAVIVWPTTRHRDVERHMLSSVVLESDDGEVTEAGKVSRWRALGLETDVPAEFRLTDNDAKVGRVVWTFAGPEEKRPPQLVIERLAMVEHWLDKRVDEWLIAELPPGSRVVDERKLLFNGHGARELLSQTKIGTLPTLMNWRRVRLDVAWRCDRDLRLYHVSYTVVVKKDQAVELPRALRVVCCQRPPVVEDDVEL